MLSDSTHGMAIATLVAVLAVLAVAPTASAVPVAEVSKVESSDVAGVQRIILDEGEAKRLGIQTAPVREEKVRRQVTVIGEVEDEPAAKASPQPSTDAGGPAATGAQRQGSPLRVKVLLDKNPEDDADDDVGQYDDEDDAEILAPGDFDEDEPLRAKRVEISAGAEAAANTLYFKIRGGAQRGLTPGQRVGVKLAAPGSDIPKRVVPYSAIIYDASGDSWVYVSPKPLEFVRQHVTIEDINQGMAVLSDGPQEGIEVVTVGAAELSGVESH